jgi:ferredoxin
MGCKLCIEPACAHVFVVEENGLRRLLTGSKERQERGRLAEMRFE